LAPERLLASGTKSSPFVNGAWGAAMDRGRAARHIVCTIKFQGPTDHAAAEAFAAIPVGRVVHLFHNKHELTFLWGAC